METFIGNFVFALVNYEVCPSVRANKIILKVVTLKSHAMDPDRGGRFYSIISLGRRWSLQTKLWETTWKHT